MKPFDKYLREYRERAAKLDAFLAKLSAENIAETAREGQPIQHERNAA